MVLPDQTKTIVLIFLFPLRLAQNLTRREKQFSWDDPKLLGISDRKVISPVRILISEAVQGLSIHFGLGNDLQEQQTSTDEFSPSRQREGAFWEIWLSSNLSFKLILVIVQVKFSPQFQLVLGRPFPGAQGCSDKSPQGPVGSKLFWEKGKKTSFKVFIKGISSVVFQMT